MEYKETIKCAQCGEEFTDYKYRERKYCSKDCFLEAKRNSRELDCEWCGETFTAKESRQNARFCSKSCRAKSQWERGVFEIKSGEDHPLYQGPVSVECWTCNKGFEVSRGYYNQAQKRDQERFYCSKECRSKGRSQRYRRENNPNYKDGNIELVCDFCGKTFERPYWEYRQAIARNQENYYCSYECRCPGPVQVECTQCGKKYEVERRLFNRAKNRDQKSWFCSKDCRYTWQSENLVGPNSSNWHGGTSFEPYGEGFDDAIRLSIRKRDGFECQLCGRPQHENRKLFGRRLSVHHIDYSKDNHSPDNLITLCHTCHCKTNGNREHFEKLFSEMLNQ